jgi:putative exporter of polyketide antibiotics
MTWIEQGFWVCLVLLAICLALPAISYVLNAWRKP